MKIKILILFALLTSTFTFAQTVEERFASELAAKCSAIHSITCDFTETRHVEILTDDEVRNGWFHYLAPTFMALDFASGDRIVMDGERFTIRTLGQTTTARMNSNPMLRQLQTILDACITGNIDRLRLSGKLDVQSDEQSYRLQLIPATRASKRYVDRIVLLFDRRDMTLDELRLEQPSGDFTRYRFRNKECNRPVDKSIFQLQ